MLFNRLSYHMICSTTSTLNFSDFLLSELSSFYLSLPFIPINSLLSLLWFLVLLISLLSQPVSVVFYFQGYSAIYEFLSPDAFYHFCFIKSQTKVVFTVSFLSLQLRKLECCQKVVVTHWQSWCSWKVELRVLKGMSKKDRKWFYERYYGGTTEIIWELQLLIIVNLENNHRDYGERE